MPLHQNVTTGAEWQEGVASLVALLESIDSHLASIDSQMATVITKLAGGLPSVLSGDKLKVTGLL